MFNTRRAWGFDWGELLTGVLFIVAGVFFIRHPQIGLVTLTLLFASIAIIRGITILAGFTHLREFNPRLSWLSLLSGVIDLVLGVLFLFNVPAGIAGLTALFAAWFLIDSVTNLLNVGHLRGFGMGWMLVSIILDVLTLFFALLLFMQPVLAAVSLASIVSIYLIIFGINAIVVAFARAR
ncbi:HdeD family acid-resistance protein [Lacticaseibacillus pantheris]|uniref:Integral membrane protein n=1 Tax=Lacticaseibacillus pantheris DSM 15945 = JCM 12539 = NBRC 106106 TaxID=1423783 RepID=A0A0R1TYP4_9LACO|nr:DUF308 domain-containing protein [Lacticaseibacillus pantheris]KRL86316.1 integral membrane protein [Lacticaseibacillus pantheris DSM 15945 = JCM 12539 = NBRC 106106]WKF85756.1 DUF308 domain-containing protein [Lacticaseibacillus pantheris]